MAAIYIRSNSDCASVLARTDELSIPNKRSHVWLPDHAERLLLVLALAYARILTLAVQTVPDLPAVDPVTFIQRGHPARSLFQHGLAFFRHCLWSGLPTALPFRLLAWPGFPSQLLC